MRLDLKLVLVILPLLLIAVILNENALNTFNLKTKLLPIVIPDTSDSLEQQEKNLTFSVPYRSKPLCNRDIRFFKLTISRNVEEQTSGVF